MGPGNILAVVDLALGREWEKGCCISNFGVGILGRCSNIVNQHIVKCDLKHQVLKKDKKIPF